MEKDGLKTVEMERKESGVLTPVLNDEDPGISMMADNGGHHCQEVLNRKMDFQPGDKVVYPGHGVAEVLGIQKMSLNGKFSSFYQLQIIGTNRRVWVPVDNLETVGVRSLVPLEEIPFIYQVMAEHRLVEEQKSWFRKYMGILSKIKTGSIYEIAETYRDLVHLSREKTLSFGERRVMQLAKELLFKEIAVVSGKSEEEVAREIETILLN